MAVKDHSLDSKITDSAMEEFLNYGFQAGSINRIAKNAGVTTGAIYTRYKNKDDLFQSLIKETLEEMAVKGSEVSECYFKVKTRDDVDLFLNAMWEEMKAYTDIIFRKYDQCRLLFCKSEGSSVDAMLKQSMDFKEKYTVEFLENITHKNMKGAGLLIKKQFGLFKLVLESGLDKDTIMSSLEMIYRFNRAGWRELFEKE